VRQEARKERKNMKLQGNGVLKSESGETICEVAYSITPGERIRGKTTDTFSGSTPPMEGKERPDAIRLTASKGLSSSEILASAILETEDGRRFNLVITSTLVPSARVLEAAGTEIEN
jgi:hypothetical protein